MNNLFEESRKPLLVLAVTSHISMDFFKGQIDFLQKAGFAIAVVCSPGWDNIDGVKYYPIAMEREISVFKDILSLCFLIKLFLKIKPTIVNAGTPKAGLLVSIAAFICKVPIKIYTCHGLRLETAVGWKRKLLVITEKISGFCADRIVCVSNSLRCKFIKLQLASEKKVTVIGAGSCNGIDLKKFIQTEQCRIRKENILVKKNVPKNAVFVGFVGRLTRDKGIYELAEAFEILKEKFPNLYLLLLGNFENGDSISEKTREKIVRDQRIIDLGFIANPVPYYQLMSLLILPTYREGFGNVLLEAGAIGIPVVASRVTGCVDVVVDGETGLLVPVGDSTALANAVAMLLTNTALAALMGQKARQRIEHLYKNEVVWENLDKFYKGLLHTKNGNSLASPV
ncbi:Capsular glucan synthase [Sporomusa ovata DSM 2662]|uniref:Alpha-1,3-N-acetylgalactosamine transferase PglA n=2 Tax=Sporomusa ovata TaxID=2378 RepID=A0A0U1L623_9FIRM|nr:glycosyltransferase family 4 protein [Sporomusa ovata]EQB28395.1 capsular polysaccharide biosynthesis glycosyltransferase CapM [Sporomusa ovata DSM 2662]CQR74719.1 Alpha-1,3-N-acetylgalactosamine transferase PglA [Sporomusa ovata]